MDTLKLIDFEDYLAEEYGAIGTPERTKYEAEVTSYTSQAKRSPRVFIKGRNPHTQEGEQSTSQLLGQLWIEYADNKNTQLISTKSCI